MENETKSKIAILIDAENVSYKNANKIMEIMSAKGDIILREVIADWTKFAKSKIIGTEMLHKISCREHLVDGWRKESAKFSMTPIQQFNYVPKKNASDMAMAIEAMKILYEKNYIDIFCLVSNDSDFTRLAQELRGHNKLVVGMGEKGKTIPEFVNAFSEFVYLDVQLDEYLDANTQTKQEEVPVINIGNNFKKEKKIEKCPIDDNQLKALIDIIDEQIESHEGVAYYSLISDNMRKKFPDFTPYNYDCKSVSKLIEKLLPYLGKYEKKSKSIQNNPNGKIMMLASKNYEKSERRTSKKL